MNKSDIRQTIIAKRKLLNADFILEASQKIFSQYLELNLPKEALVACYSPIHGEVDTKLIIENTPRILLPRVMRGSKILDFHTDDGKKYLPEIILAPLVAFDSHGNRLGFGGGYYDATLNYYKAIHHNFLYIGLAYDFQEVAEIPTDNHDFPLQGVITESKTKVFLTPIQ
ncbi:MAG: 5-formyltetrahydrofolate cyclo-ligase [Alphaproteobacteria bacterium]|jgi:5-formyltetrahydrofolate cyclo-ligase|nr:5-formyltetrahydrofolate cyclo-ligase [Alphaproteobacteria bacterium]